MVQEVVRSYPDDFYVLCMRLRESFKKTQMSRRSDFSATLDNQTEAKRDPREYYGRTNILATELRTVYNVDVTDDTICKALVKRLPDTAKTSFLQV